MHRRLHLLAILLVGCNRCGDGAAPTSDPRAETAAVEGARPAGSDSASDPPIASPVPLSLVIRHPPAVGEVLDAAADCRPLGTTAGPAVNGVSEGVALGPAGAVALYPTERLADDYQVATVLSLAPDGTAREPAQLTIRGLIRRIEPLEEGFVIVTGHNDFTVGLVTHLHAYVIDGEGRFGGHLEITAGDRSELDGIGSGGEGTLRFFFATNPSQQSPMIIVEVRRDATGALTRSELSVPVHVPQRGAPGRSMVVALPPPESAMALVLHPDHGAELLRGTRAVPVESLGGVRGSWFLGNPVRAVATEGGTRLHVAGDGGGLFAVDGDEVRSVAAEPELATTLGEEEPVEVRIVDGRLDVGASAGSEPPELAWYGTTMAQLAAERLSLLDCRR